jgi:hypothetical protein
MLSSYYQNIIFILPEYYLHIFSQFLLTVRYNKVTLGVKMVVYLLGRESLIDVFIRHVRTISACCSDVVIPFQTPLAAKDWMH